MNDKEAKELEIYRSQMKRAQDSFLALNSEAQKMIAISIVNRLMVALKEINAYPIRGDE